MTATVHAKQTNFYLNNVGSNVLADNSYLLPISFFLSRKSLFKSIATKHQWPDLLLTCIVWISLIFIFSTKKGIFHLKYLP